MSPSARTGTGQRTEGEGAVGHGAAGQRSADERSAGDRLSVGRNFVLLTVGRFLAALSMWIALIVLTKLSGDPSTVGVYALAQVICLPLAEVARMGLRDLRASDTRGEFLFRDYLGLRLLAAGLALVAMIGAGIAKADSGTVFAVILLYALTRVLELVSDVVYGLFQAQERMDLIARSLCLQGPLSLGLLTLGYWATDSLVVAVLGQVAAHAIVLCAYDLPVGRARAALEVGDGEAFWPRWNRSALRRLSLLALPLTFATLLAMVAAHLPRFAVESYLGIEALGFFAPILALALAPTRLVHALGMAATTRLAHYHADGERQPFVALLGRMTFGAALLGLAGVLVVARFGEQILSIVYTPDYAPYSYVLLLTVLAATLRFVSDMLQCGIIASRRFWWFAFQYGSVALAAVVACVTLIPAHGMVGAGWAVLVTFALQLAVISIGMLRNLPTAHERTRETAA